MEKYKEIIQFIRKLYNQPDGVISLHAPVFSGNEKKYLNDCVDSTYVSSVGKFVDRFEEKIVEFTGANYAVAVVNGTAALHIALLMTGVKLGDEVITQPLTFIATANAISYCNAKPIFIDVDRDTMGLSPEKLEYFLKNNTRWDSSTSQLLNTSTSRPIRACVPMHTFGHPCKIDEIIQICEKYNLPVIEDAAESLGSFYKGKHTGTFGKLGILSFNGNKIITTGGGGMIITNDEYKGNHIKHLTTQAKVSHPWEFVHDHIGYNYRMPNLNAAFGVAQMEQLNNFIEIKRGIAQQYKEFFKKIDVDFFNEPKNGRSNYWLNVVIFENRSKRDAFLKYTNENGIMTRPVWEMMNRLAMFKECFKGNLSNSEWLADRVVNIPSSVV